MPNDTFTSFTKEHADKLARLENEQIKLSENLKNLFECDPNKQEISPIRLLPTTENYQVLMSILMEITKWNKSVIEFYNAIKTFGDTVRENGLKAAQSNPLTDEIVDEIREINGQYRILISMLKRIGELQAAQNTLFRFVERNTKNFEQIFGPLFKSTDFPG